MSSATAAARSIALELREVHKRLGRREVLRGASLAFEGPGVLLVKGANGAGKSTLLRLVAGILQTDKGDVLIAGTSVERYRRKALRELGYVPEAADLPAHLTARELALLAASLKACDAPRADVGERLGATPFLDQPFGSLSAGQRRRALLYAALVGDPALLALDEPDAGLDVAGVEMLAALLRERTAAGRATVVTTHDASFGDSIATERLTLADGLLAP